MMYKLAPSLLAADFKTLGEEVKKIDKAGAELVHIDVMDGSFVPSISFGMPVIQSIRTVTKREFDVHLMIEEPDRYIDDFVKCGADIITVHAEACSHLHRTVLAIREAGVKACVALNPATPLSVLEYVLDELDMVLIMSVNPGFGGQKFIPSSLNKIEKLFTLIKEKELSVDIEADGGINRDNAEAVIRAGANIIVAGTAVYRGNVMENVAAFKEVFNRVESDK